MAESPTTAHFDADAMTAAQETPTLTVGNFLYRGRLLSIEQWLPWWERYLALQREKGAAAKDEGDAKAYLLTLRAFYADYLRAVFPRRDFRFWAPDPVKHLMAKPFLVIEEAAFCFFSLQALATFGPAAMKSLMPNVPPGTPSRSETPAESEAK